MPNRAVRSDSRPQAHSRGNVRPKTFFNPRQAPRLARRRGDREQEVVELNSKVLVRDERNKKAEKLEVTVQLLISCGSGSKPARQKET